MMRTRPSLCTALASLAFAGSLAAQPAPDTEALPAEAPATDSSPGPNPGANALEPAEAPADDVPVEVGPGHERFYEPAPVVVLSGPKQRPAETGVRAERRLAVLGELGWNSLSGFGANLIYHATPHLAGDLGAGASATGWKLGLRARYNLLKSPVTPFAGMGFMATSGFGSAPQNISFDDANEFAIRVKPSYFVQAVLGIDYTSPRGFTMVMTAGYAWVLNDNVVVVSGTPTEQDEKLLEVIFRSSLATSIAIGYSFK
jgi:hypothetical protein